MRQFITNLLVLVFVIITMGCASIVGSRMQVMTINSTPDQADVLIKDEMNKNIFSGQTPASVTLKKGEGYFHGKDYIVTIHKEGYADRVVKIESRAGGWYLFGNLLFGGLIGWFIVDPITGAMWTLKPEKVDETLERQKSSGAIS